MRASAVGIQEPLPPHFPSCLPLQLPHCPLLQAAKHGGNPPAWDESGWHYDADAAEGGPLTAQYVLVLDALNFCFWPSKTAMEYDTLAVGLKKALEADPAAFSAEKLMAMTPELLRSWFTPHDMPNAEERARKLQEVGTVLQRDYKGQAAELVKAAGGSACRLVELLTSSFPGFRDEAVYGGRQIFLYKRAQICVADIWAAYGRKREAGSSPYAFLDIEQLTCFADYRIPQLFRAMDIFVYTSKLGSIVDLKGELEAGSDMEVEIRACTVYAVEALRAAVNKRIEAAGAAAGGAGAAAQVAHPLTSVEVDWYLWQQGEAKKDAILPHHRTLTVFY